MLFRSLLGMINPWKPPSLRRLKKKSQTSNFHSSANSCPNETNGTQFSFSCGGISECTIHAKNWPRYCRTAGTFHSQIEFYRSNMELQASIGLSICMQWRRTRLRFFSSRRVLSNRVIYGKNRPRYHRTAGGFHSQLKFCRSNMEYHHPLSPPPDLQCQRERAHFISLIWFHEALPSAVQFSCYGWLILGTFSHFYRCQRKIWIQPHTSPPPGLQFQRERAHFIPLIWFHKALPSAVRISCYSSLIPSAFFPIH